MKGCVTILVNRQIKIIKYIMFVQQEEVNLELVCFCLFLISIKSCLQYLVFLSINYFGPAKHYSNILHNLQLQSV